MEDPSEDFIEMCNSFLEREASGYRFVDSRITQITAPEEIAAIEDSIANSSGGIREHLVRALDFLSDRKAPDYRNSIKESISAVEATCKAINASQKGDLNQALEAISTKVGIHSALKQSLTKLYAYTSDEKGIRHALMDQPNVSFEDAKFMLVSCAAFTSYLRAKAAKAGISLG